MNVLFVTYGLPYPPDRGAKIRDFFLIKNISQHHPVLLLSLIESPEDIQYLSQLKPYCKLIDVVVLKRRSFRKHISGILRSLRSGRPLATHPFFYEEMAQKIRVVTETQDVDIIQIEHTFLAPYVDFLSEGSRCKTILDMHNVGFQQYRRMIRLNIGAVQKLEFVLKWLMMLGWEPNYAQRFSHCLVVSKLEEKLLKSKNPALPVSVIENGVDTTLYRPLEEISNENILLLVGTIGYPPNRDAVMYFCKSILPLILRRIPNVKLYIIGHAPTPEIRKISTCENIMVTGSVPDVLPYYQEARLSIAPIRAGGGTRLKILESMALGRPVVSTSLGCEGLDVVDQEHIMIADTPTEFAERVIQLLMDKELRQKISRQAQELVEIHYDWSMISQKLLMVYGGLRAQSGGEP